MLISVPLSKSNQITLPSAVRKLLKLQPGECIAFDTEARTFAKAETDEEKIRRLFNELELLHQEHEKHATPAQKAFAEKTRGWTATQIREYIDSLPETKAYRKEKYGL